MAMNLGIEEGSYRVLPVKITPFEDSALPLRLRMLSMTDLTRESRAECEFERLVNALKGPLPRRGSV
jgi:hypothetical protein